MEKLKQLMIIDTKKWNSLSNISFIDLNITAKIQKFSFLIFVFILTLNSCVNTKSINNTDIECINFGNGGGFAGLVNIYSLSSDGKLNKLVDNKYTAIKTIDKKIIKDFFEEAKELKLYQFNEPENMFSFIEIKTNGSTNKIVWSNGSTKIDKRVIELYNKLITTIK